MFSISQLYAEPIICTLWIMVCGLYVDSMSDTQNWRGDGTELYHQHHTCVWHCTEWVARQHPHHPGCTGRQLAARRLWDSRVWRCQYQRPVSSWAVAGRQSDSEPSDAGVSVLAPDDWGSALWAREWVSALCVWGVGVSFVWWGSGCQLCVFGDWVSALCAGGSGCQVC